MSALVAEAFTPAQRRVALLWGAVCHLSFLTAVTTMMVGLYSGMDHGGSAASMGWSHWPPISR